MPQPNAAGLGAFFVGNFNVGHSLHPLTYDEVICILIQSEKINVNFFSQIK